MIYSDELKGGISKIERNRKKKSKNQYFRMRDIGFRNIIYGFVYSGYVSDYGDRGRGRF
jgi:hypothetical protein